MNGIAYLIGYIYYEVLVTLFSVRIVFFFFFDAFRLVIVRRSRPRAEFRFSR